LLQISNLDWALVMSKLDHAGFMLRNLKSVMTLLQIYHIACNVRSERAARYRNCLRPA